MNSLSSPYTSFSPHFIPLPPSSLHLFTSFPPPLSPFPPTPSSPLTSISLPPPLSFSPHSSPFLPLHPLLPSLHPCLPPSSPPPPPPLLSSLLSLLPRWMVYLTTVRVKHSVTSTNVLLMTWQMLDWRVSISASTSPPYTTTPYLRWVWPGGDVLP